MSRPITFAFGFAFAFASIAATFQAQVTRVIDGDTLQVRRGQVLVTVRLDGIDAPETLQRFGAAATYYIRRACAGADVLIEDRGSDRYRRTLGRVRLADGTDLSEAMVRTGHAWWYFHYAPTDARLKAAQEAARGFRLGLWADSDPTPPWEFRKGPVKSSTYRGATIKWRTPRLSDKPPVDIEADGLGRQITRP